MSKYRQDYRTLGIEPGCSVQSLKSARRRLIKSWHPDHFSAANKATHEAEHRIKEINTAFDRLIDYYRNFGVLPGDTTADPAFAATVPPPSAPRAPSSDPDVTPPPSTRRPRLSVTLFRWTLVLAALGLVIETAHVILKQDQADPTAVIAEGLPKLQNTPHSTESPAVPSSPRKSYFTIGSSLSEVYVAQGIPTATGHGVWHYGKSAVYFSQGAVTGWSHDPADPLHVSLLPDSTAQQGTALFTIGSTKAEVRAVQGSPLVETDAVWDFGLSKVYFRDGRVVGWDTSPMHPLRTRK